MRIPAAIDPEAVRHILIEFDPESVHVGDTGRETARQLAPGGREMHRIHEIGTEDMVFTEREGLIPDLGVSILGREEDVGWGVEGWNLCAVDEVSRIQIILFVDGVINTGIELVVRGDLWNGIVDETAIVNINRRTDCRKLFDYIQ